LAFEGIWGNISYPPCFDCVSFFFTSLSVFENIDLCVVEEVEVECKKLRRIKYLHNKIWTILASGRLVKIIVKVLVDMETNSLSIIFIHILNVFA
jgi:hypothetical protein